MARAYSQDLRERVLSATTALSDQRAGSEATVESDPTPGDRRRKKVLFNQCPWWAGGSSRAK